MEAEIDNQFGSFKSKDLPLSVKAYAKTEDEVYEPLRISEVSYPRLKSTDYIE